MASQEEDEDPFPEFQIDSTARRTPKRATAHVDADGCREYTLTKCPHGCGTTLELLSSNYKRLRPQVIRDHLADAKQCPHYQGARPEKSSRGGMSVQALTVKPTAASRPVVALIHKDCVTRYAALEERVSMLEKRGEVYDAALRVVLPTIVLPLQERLAETQLRHAIVEVSRASSSALPEAAPSLLQDAAQLRKRLRVVEEERDAAVASLHEMTRKFNDLKGRTNIKSVKFHRH